MTQHGASELAVALIPPLCAAGLMLEEGRYILATGALLLFAANFIGIAIASIFVFFLSGIAHVENRRGWFIGGAVITAIAVMLITGPLAANYKQLGFTVTERRQAYQDVAQVLRMAPGYPTIVGLSIEGGLLTIALRPFPNDPAERGRLTDAIHKKLHLQVELAAGIE
jgi:uncharacterized membrane protein